MDRRTPCTRGGKRPSMTTFEPHHPIETQADLHQVWCGLMEPLGFSASSIWMLRIAPDRRAVPHLVEIADADEVPSSTDVRGLSEVLRMLDETEPGHGYAFLRSRPGRGVTGDDRRWASFLHDAGRAAGVRVEVVHLATDEEITPLPLDEIGLRRAG